DGSIIGTLLGKQFGQLLWGSWPGTQPAVPTDLAAGMTTYGQAIIDLNGTAIRATRASVVRSDGSFDVTLGNTRDWSDFGFARVDSLGHVIVGGKTIYTLNTSNKTNLLLGAWPPPTTTTAAAQPVAAH